MPSRPPSADVIIHIDGASRGNPGLAACGVVVETRDGAPLTAFSKSLGQTTNNVAEYHALLAALEYALSHQHLKVRVMSDSELLARQIEGKYKVKSPDLRPLHEKARALISRFEFFSIAHVPREQNRQADRLANQALDAAEVGAGLKPAPTIARSTTSGPLRTSATYHEGVLRPHRKLPLVENEEVDLEIRRKK